MDRTTSVLIEEELQSSFLDYAMSVVVSRAIPDVRDGLKPVHRRILYAMHSMGLHHTKPYRKSVRVVGDVLGKYHPHGDQAVYNTMVGMVQDFSRRYPLLDGHGNWGSVDGDNAAAMRYTEIRMHKIAQDILADLDKETVPFVPNFDDSAMEPTLLPSKIPLLLVNGTAGIAVGMATAIPPHNLREVCAACREFLRNPDMTDDELFACMPAPDFPTGGIICGTRGVHKAYRTGRGSVIVRAVVEVEEHKKGGASLVVTELPYQVAKADLIVKIADLVKNKVIEGISDIRDESDRNGMRLVIEVARGEIPDVVLNQLYKHTQMQASIKMLMLALLDNQPVVFPLRRLIREFLRHREQVIYRRTEHELGKAEARYHILQGFVIALQHVDAVVALIKASRTTNEANEGLCDRFGLSQTQAKAILEMRLQRFTGLEQEKIYQEMNEITQTIQELRALLNDPERIKQEIINELDDIERTYGDERRTRIMESVDTLTDTDLIPDEEMVVTLTRRGYIKRVPLDVYGVQHRGGKGKRGMAALDDTGDVVHDIFVTRNHDNLLFFTNFGRVYTQPVYELPEASRTAKGRAIVNLLPLQEGETVVKLLCAREMSDAYVVMVTKNGTIKRTAAEAFANVRSTGIRAITMRDQDELAFCCLSSGEDTVILATAQGQGLRFDEAEVRVMGRQANGVRGIRLREGDSVVGMQVVGSQEGKDVMIATQYGYGKRVATKDFRIAHRGGLGVRTIPTTKRNGEVIGLIMVDDTTDVLLIDQSGKIIRLSPQEVRTMGRQAKGVRLIRLAKGQRLVSIVSVPARTSEDEQPVTPDQLSAE